MQHWFNSNWISTMYNIGLTLSSKKIHVYFLVFYLASCAMWHENKFFGLRSGRLSNVGSIPSLFIDCAADLLIILQLLALYSQKKMQKIKLIKNYYLISLDHKKVRFLKVNNLICGSIKRWCIGICWPKNCEISKSFPRRHNISIILSKVNHYPGINCYNNFDSIWEDWANFGSNWINWQFGPIFTIWANLYLFN